MHCFFLWGKLQFLHSMHLGARQAVHFRHLLRRIFPCISEDETFNSLIGTVDEEVEEVHVDMGVAVVVVVVVVVVLVVGEV